MPPTDDLPVGAIPYPPTGRHTTIYKVEQYETPTMYFSTLAIAQQYIGQQYLAGRTYGWRLTEINVDNWVLNA